MMTGGQKPNKPLFSQHYLEHRIQECPEWQVDVRAGFEALNKLYQSQKDLLPTLSEAQTEEVFIKPALDILGFSHIPQVTTRGKGRAERPDYALFTDETDRDAAYPLQNDEPAFYARVRAIAEAKYWERPLSKVSSNDQRDIYKNANPSFQIASYLTGTGVDWGILTNGREWRLYYRQASSTATEFYPVDLVDLLESGDLEAFKYFWLFFRREALVKDPQGRNFLERVREGSTTYSTRVGNELKTLVFNQIFPQLAGGFVKDATRRGEKVSPEQVHEATLAFLYKLLFLLYAEARNLLPIDHDYRDHSLIKMTQAIAEDITRQKNLSATSTGLYDRLLSLFQIVDRGDSALKVPRYNGGLFHFNFSQPSDRAEYRANYFLSRFKLTDEILSPELDHLARFEGQPIDYSFLGVRQLGSIYEGLLEYRVVMTDDATDNVHLENDKGERKATGSYYTPDYIVKYIVSHTLKPILEQRQARFGELMGQISQIHHQLQDKRLGTQSQNGLRKDLQRLEREAQGTLLDIKVCDPAMGSGHFLVEAVDYLTDELIRILNAYPDHNPVLEMLEQTRQSILQNLHQQGITVHPDHLEPTQLLQRVVMKRCIYGVDLNPMAVELAKVSLWLHSFTIGAPLSFLDHHLRCGNSLIGTTAREAEAAMAQEESGQLLILTGPFVGLLSAAKTIMEISETSDATFQQVEQSEQSFKRFIDLAEPFKYLLDVYTSQHFGVKEAKNFLERYGTNAINIKPEKISSMDASILKKAEQIQHEKRFFHWDLEFPEVFIDLENASWKDKAGFDAVFSNPPYIDIKNLEKEIVKYFFKTYSTMQLRINIFAAFLEQALELSSSKPGQVGFIIPSAFLTQVSYAKLRQQILENYWLKSIVRLPNELFGEAVGDVKVDTCLLTVYSRPFEITEDLKTEILAYNSFERVDLISSKTASSFLNVRQNNWLEAEDAVITIINDDESNIIKKIQKVSNHLELYCEFCLGITPYDKYRGHTEQEIKEQVFHAKKQLEPAYKKLLVSGDVKRYEVTWNGEEWIKYGEWLAAPRESRFFNQERILIQQIIDWSSLRIFVGWTDEELYNTQNQFNLLPYPQTNLKFVLAILASRLISFYHRKVFLDTALQRFQKILIKDAKNFPIRRIGLSIPADLRQQALQNVISLYQNFQANHNPDTLLAQVDSHLSQQPEEADVVHDLLAYLAEQMIELNKQKQAEIKGFLQWLERFIGCPIDTLTNKSKIKNYLGNYYKKGTDRADVDNDTGEPHLSFDDLIELLKKNKKKIKIDPTARKEQQTLEKEYEASLETLLPIKMQLMQCDRLIDQIVYKLYGLTAEEIAIVEGTRSTNVESQ